MIQQRENAKKTSPEQEPQQVSLDFTDNDPLPFTSPKAHHHHISELQCFHDDITQWLTKNCDDPALKVRQCIHLLFPMI